jgi:hypothetical protein
MQRSPAARNARKLAFYAGGWALLALTGISLIHEATSKQVCGGSARHVDHSMWCAPLPADTSTLVVGVVLTAVGGILAIITVLRSYEARSDGR